RSVQSVARLQDIEHTDNATGLSRVSKIDLNAIEERFLSQNRDQFLAIDEQDMVIDRGSRAETHILNIDQTHFETHPLPGTTESLVCQRRVELALVILPSPPSLRFSREFIG